MMPHETSPLLVGRKKKKKTKSGKETNESIGSSWRSWLLWSTGITTLLLAGVTIFSVTPRDRNNNHRVGPMRTRPSNLHHHDLQHHSTTTVTATATTSPTTRIAFIGNSMFYFNDFPRFFQTLAEESSQSVTQNSCLHGGGSIPSLWMEGNGMYTQFETPEAIIYVETTMNQSDTVDDNNTNVVTIYDYGACTVAQLLTGQDDRLDDPGYSNFDEIVLANNATTIIHNQNPCRVDPNYFQYATEYFSHEIMVAPNQNTNNNHPNNDGTTFVQNDYWDYVIINDNTRDPARFASRMHSLQFLEAFYIPILQQMTAVPIFLWTHAYSIPSTTSRNMTGLDNVANFTSLTGVGYRNYVNLLSQHLSPSQHPRIAPVGLGFLMVYEERPDLWIQLFHNADHLHASPSGTYLQGLIVYHTIFGEMPQPPSTASRSSTSTTTTADAQYIPQHLWRNVRMMQHAWEPPNPYPTLDSMVYLYNVAERIMVHGELPRTYTEYDDDVYAYEG